MQPKPETKRPIQLNRWVLSMYLILFLILLASSILEYRSRYRDMERLMQDQATMTATIISSAGSGQSRLSAEIQRVYVDRAIDLLVTLDQLETGELLGVTDLDQLPGYASVFRIMAVDTTRQMVWVNESGGRNANGRMGLGFIRHLDPVLSGEMDTLVTEMGQGGPPWQSNARSARFMVAIRRSAGGAWAANLSVDGEAHVKSYTDLQPLLQDIIQETGLAYIALVSPDAPSLVVSADSSLLELPGWEHGSDQAGLNRIRRGDNYFLELDKPISWSLSHAHLKIGFHEDYLHGLRQSMVVQVIIRGVMMILLAILTFIFLLARQNAALLSRERDRIQDEVRRLEALQRLREKQVAMGELAAGVAHEIRNPLNAIGILAQRLAREFQPSDEVQEYKDLTATMAKEIKRINQTLQNFLEYARPTPLEVNTIHLSSVLDDLQKLYGPAAREKKIEMVFPGKVSLELEVDADYLKQALGNIIKNAIEASPVSGRITIQAESDRKKVLLSIHDEGPGIPADQQERIFDLFYTTKEEGTGVGLAVTHKIIADHGGSISFESSSQSGTLFSITLPRGGA